MKILSHWSGRPRMLAAAAASAALAALVVGCHSGTPAAPEGTEIPVSCEFLSRDVTTGDFEALIKAVVIDEESDVPQVGVGVYFRVSGGPGEMSDEGPIRTDNAGRAQSVLIGRGATVGNDVTVDVSSGSATAEITLDVGGCFSATAVRPRLVATVTPNPAPNPTASNPTEVTVDLSRSTDSDCPGGEPDSWSINWGDGETTTDQFADEDSPTHDYVPSDVPTDRTVTIDIEVEDCQNLTDTDTVELTFNP
jgi:hypothetical protein